jgi:hypothetical protein
MKRSTCVLAGLVLLALPAQAQDPPEKSWSLEAGVDWSSIYLFRGVDLLNDESVVAPRAVWSWGGLAVSYFGDFGDLPGAKRYVEGDLAADYTFEIGKAKLTLGAVTYQYNDDAERLLAFHDTDEAYGILAFDLPLSPTLSYNYDFDQIDGGYLSFALRHRFPLGSKVALKLLGSAGFDFHFNNKNVTGGTFNDILFSVDVPVRISDHFAIHAGAQRSFAQKALDEIVKADPSLESGYGDQTVVTAGATVSF